MRQEDCPSYEGCGAPICPMNENSMIYSQWFPDEEICCSRKYCKEHWIKNQRKIRQLYNKGHVDDEHYFAHSMLIKMVRVRQGIKGRDPDNWTSGIASPE